MFPQWPKRAIKVSRVFCRAQHIISISMVLKRVIDHAFQPIKNVLIYWYVYIISYCRGSLDLGLLVLFIFSNIQRFFT